MITKFAAWQQSGNAAQDEGMAAGGMMPPEGSSDAGYAAMPKGQGGEMPEDGGAYADAGMMQPGLSRELLLEVMQLPPEQLELLAELIMSVLQGEDGGMYPENLGGMPQDGMQSGAAGQMPTDGAPMILPTEGQPYPATLGGYGGMMQ